MAITNKDRVSKALDLLRDGLAPYVNREIKNNPTPAVKEEISKILERTPAIEGKKITEWDASPLLGIMWNCWNQCFGLSLGRAERNLVSEVRDVRHNWAHQGVFSSDDTDRALDSISRLLTAISAPQADEVNKMKLDLRRLVYDEMMRTEKRRSASTSVESKVDGSMKPWREVITPHKDVQSGQYQQAEFAADLWQVHKGEAASEYRDPVEFFRRTYITEGLKELLVNAVRRIGHNQGDPVVQLQTNFGGGKTHSMLALYHLVSGTPAADLVGVDEVLATSGDKKPPNAKRIVLVGNKISPSDPSKKPDGTKVHTLWGELAWQLGGKPAYDKIKADDENATNPGDKLTELFNEYGPALVLIDEWVAYARQLHDEKDLCGGSFDTQFTFAQTLTEAAKDAKNTLVMVSLPASTDAGASPHANVNEEEVGGIRGRTALERLDNVVRRIAASWRPASSEEGFEIVRRRLFEPISDKGNFVQRDLTARTFSEFYQKNHQDFPSEAKESEYEKRMKAAYPIHPEVFDQLYTSWSTLVKFQRTRGVLRLMAAVIHSLWEKGNRDPMILPCHIPLDDARIREELSRYLSDNWVPIIEKDVDGPNSLPLKIDGSVGTLGTYHACRRVARTIFLGTAPTMGVANQGLEDIRVKLGAVMPGEPPAQFADGLRRLSQSATYLYTEGSRYWYSVQPTVTKLADDRAEQLKQDVDKVHTEVRKRLTADLGMMGDFNRIHTMPSSDVDVPDDVTAALVVLSPEHPCSKDADNQAVTVAKKILEKRGNSPRLYRNTLVFLAADQTRLTDLDVAIRKYLAWQSILDEKESLDLTPGQVRQAQTQLSAADGAVKARIPETYKWLLVPTQHEDPKANVEWQATQLTGQEALAPRATKKLKNEGQLVPVLAGSYLRGFLDRVPLWRGDNVSVKQLMEDFARYTYLPRLADQGILLRAIEDGISQLTWETDGFAYADSHDATAGRYRGLKYGRHVVVDVQNGMLIKPEAAQKQIEAEKPEPQPQPGTEPFTSGDGQQGSLEIPSGNGSEAQAEAVQRKPRRYHGSVALDSTRVGRDAGKIADEVIVHLAGLMGANVKVRLEISAEIPDGAPENVVRTVTENSRTLKFDSHGFESS